MGYTYTQLKEDGKGECIVVGTTVNNKKVISYGGLIRPNPKKHFTFKIIPPEVSKPVEC